MPVLVPTAAVEESVRSQVETALAGISGLFGDLQRRVAALEARGEVRSMEGPGGLPEVPPPPRPQAAEAPGGQEAGGCEVAQGRGAGEVGPFPAPPPSGPEAGELEVGDPVEIYGLNGAQELNGKRGTIVTFVRDTQRFGVKLDEDGVAKAVKSVNLKRLEKYPNPNLTEGTWKAGEGGRPEAKGMPAIPPFPQLEAEEKEQEEAEDEEAEAGQRAAEELGNREVAALQGAELAALVGAGSGGQRGRAEAAAQEGLGEARQCGPRVGEGAVAPRPPGRRGGLLREEPAVQGEAHRGPSAGRCSGPEGGASRMQGPGWTAAHERRLQELWRSGPMAGWSQPRRAAGAAACRRSAEDEEERDARLPSLSGEGASQGEGQEPEEREAFWREAWRRGELEGAGRQLGAPVQPPLGGHPEAGLRGEGEAEEAEGREEEEAGKVEGLLEAQPPLGGHPEAGLRGEGVVRGQGVDEEAGLAVEGEPLEEASVEPAQAAPRGSGPEEGRAEEQAETAQV